MVSVFRELNKQLQSNKTSLIWKSTQNVARLWEKKVSQLGKSRPWIPIWAETCRNRRLPDIRASDWAMGEGTLDTGLRQMRRWNFWGFIISNTWPMTHLTTHRDISVRQPHYESNLKHNRNLFRLSERERVHCGHRIVGRHGKAAAPLGKLRRGHIWNNSSGNQDVRIVRRRGSRTWGLTRWVHGAPSEL